MIRNVDEDNVVRVSNAEQQREHKEVKDNQEIKIIKWIDFLVATVIYLLKNLLEIKILRFINVLADESSISSLELCGYFFLFISRQ